MRIAVGNDIIANHRIREALQNYGDRFVKKLFSNEEIEYCSSKKDPVPHFAARFACKEAFIKAIDAGSDIRLDMKEIELAGLKFGKKKLSLSGKSREMFELKGFSHAEVSISHCEEYATAVVLLYKE
ncbi:MAG: holo-ACP synthase [Leptospira sp.]|nr:holo-ACP synthase [Leptospira sp.]